MADDKGEAPIIIKKVKKGGGHGHHGGAWKVAYADFVTAMMAFFLLLWLLNVATEEQLHGIADYFRPASVSVANSGSGGVMGGLTMIEDGNLVSDLQPMGVQTMQPGEGEFDQQDAGYPAEVDPSIETSTIDAEKLTEQDFERIKAREEEKQFQQAEEELKAAISEVPELQDFAKNIIMDRTPEGLRIQIVDSQGRSMFPLSSAEMHEFTGKILGKIAQVVNKLPNQISVRGHTDGRPFSAGASYNNWDLSADRANATRRALLDGGLPQERINNVVGKADRDHLLTDDPFNPRNRRVSIILLRESQLTGEKATNE